MQREITALTPTSDQLTVATFNVENLDPSDGAAKFNALAQRIVTNLGSPDILSLEEVQDNNGATNDAIIDASTTFNTLIAAIAAAGGPTYQFQQINPVDDQDGGEPGGNIRVGFLYNSERVQFVERPGGTATSNTTVNSVNGVPQLSASPGRIAPTNSDFNSSRKPLAGEFIFNGQTVFVVANHFNSKGGDQPLFGQAQPPTLSSETQRNQQATQVANFIESILAIDANANANVIVMGDINDFPFSTPLSILKQAGLTNLLEMLPETERYTYVFEGNSQALDHILVSNHLSSRTTGIDVVHINSEFVQQDSDHDPIVARFNFGTLPPVLPTVTLTATDAQAQEAGSDPGSFRISRTGTATTELIVNYQVATGIGQATGGSDYTPTLSGTATLPIGASLVDIVITPIDDGVLEGDEVVTLTLSTAATYQLGTVTTATISLLDNDTTPIPAGQTFIGTTAANTLIGGPGDDILLGLAGNDALIGDAGNDSLNGGPGKDRQRGGNGADEFIYSGTTQRQALANSRLATLDLIFDFNALEGDRFKLDYDNDLSTPNLPRGLFNAGVQRTSTLAGAVRSAFVDKNQRRRGNQALRANEAVVLGWRGQQFLVVNDNQAGFGATRDLVVNVTGMTFAPGDARAGVLPVTGYFS